MCGKPRENPGKIQRKPRKTREIQGKSTENLWKITGKPKKNKLKPGKIKENHGKIKGKLKGKQEDHLTFAGSLEVKRPLFGISIHDISTLLLPTNAA